MKISAWKKTAAWGLALTMMMSLTACGGGKGGNTGDDASQKNNSETKNMVFSGETVDLKDVKGDPGTFVVADDKIYFLATDYISEAGDSESETTEETIQDDTANTEADTEEETTEENKSEETSEETTETAFDSEVASEEDVNYTIVTRIYSMNLDGTGITEVCEPALENKDEYFQYLVLDKDNKIMLISSTYNQKTESQQYFMSKIDDSGKLTDHLDFTELLGLDKDIYISNVFVDDKSNTIVITDQGVVVLDANNKKTAEIKDENNTWIEASTKSASGKVICGMSGEDDSVVREVDVEKKKFGEPIKLELRYFNGSDSLMAGKGDYDFFYKNDSGVYGYSIKDKASKKILDFMASEINSNNTYGITPVDAEHMISSGWDEKGAVFTYYTKVDASQIKDKITITYGALWGIDDAVKNAAIKFNKENDKYRIEFKDYGDDNSEESNAQTKLNADIAAGNVPDIIDLNNLPVEQYVGKGILEDLTPYLEKDDIVKKDDILPSVLKAMEVDGKIYYVSSSFSIQTLLASKKDVGDKTGWNFDEFKKLLDEKGEDVRPFYSDNKSDTLTSFLYSCLDDYIDWGTGECKFNSDDFKSLLEIANRGTNEEMEYSEDNPSQPELIKKGKVLFADAGYIDIESVQVYKQMFNSDISFIGYPCEDKKGSFMCFNNQIGIYSKSKVKDGAWEFIRTLLTKEYQAGDGYMWNNPTNKDAFEMFMKSKTATKPYKDEFGNDIEPIEGSWGWDDMEIKVGPLSADEEKLYRDLIDNTTKVVVYDNSVFDIINEEAKNYFSGQKGLDETADIIQNRATTYVNENR